MVRSSQEPYSTPDNGNNRYCYVSNKNVTELTSRLWFLAQLCQDVYLCLCGSKSQGETIRRKREQSKKETSCKISSFLNKVWRLSTIRIREGVSQRVS